MKCPACNFVCSDSKDICPKCHGDLRDHKQALGLEVADADLPYKKLLEQTLQQGCTQVDTGGGIGGFFKSFLPIGQAAPPSTPPRTTRSAQRPSPSTTNKQASRPAPSTPRASEVFEDEMALLTRAMMDLEGGYDSSAAQRPTNFPPAIKPAEEPPKPTAPAASVPDFSRMIEDIVTQTANAAINVSAVKNGSDETSSTPVRATTGESQSPLPTEENFEPEASLEETSSAGSGLQGVELQQEMATHYVYPPCVIADELRKECDEQFGGLLNMLSGISDNGSMELSFEHMQQGLNREEVNILFDLSDEAIGDPALISRYLAQLPSSDGRAVHAEELHEELKHVEKATSRAFFTFRETMSDSRSRMTGRIAPSGPPPPAPFVPHCLSFAIDTMVATAIAFCISLIITSMTGTKASVVLHHLYTFDLIESLPFIGQTLCCTAVMLVLYPLTALLNFKKTMGYKLLGLRLVCERGKNPSTQCVIVRTLSIPLSIATFGYLPIFAGKQSLQDYVSRTIVTQRSL